jgi:hypothetical protein
MNGAPMHLILNHLPVLGTLFTFLLLLWGVVRRNETIQKTALAALVIVGLSAIPVYLSGESAEEVIEEMPGVEEAYIEAHETMGKFALWAGIALGVAAIAGIGVVATRPASTTSAAVALLVLNALVFGVMAYTAHTGGQIRHPEIRSQRASPAEAGTQQGETGKEAETD